MPFFMVCTFVDAIKTASRDSYFKEDLLTLPLICFDDFDPASLMLFPGACNFSNYVKSASGKH